MDSTRVRRVRHLAIALLCTTIGACGGSSQSGEQGPGASTGPSENSDGSGDDTTGPPSGVETECGELRSSHLTVPATLREEASLGFVVQDNESRTHMAVEQKLSLQLLSGEPTRLAVNLNGPLDVRCLNSWHDRALALEEVELLSGAATVDLVDPTSISVEVPGMGISEVILRGRVLADEEPSSEPCEFYDVDEPSIEIHLSIDAREPTWSVDDLGTCNGVRSGGSLVVYTSASDESGAHFAAHNLLHPELLFTTSDGVEIAPVCSEAAMAPTPSLFHLPEVAAWGSGFLYVEAPGSPARSVPVFEPADLDGAELRFEIGDIVTRAGIEVFDGDRLELGARQIAVFVQSVHHAGVPLCGRPSTEDFHLRSLTPERCHVIPSTAHREWLPERLEFSEFGTCTFAVEAPAFANGVGFEQRATVTLLDRAE